MSDIPITLFSPECRPDPSIARGRKPVQYVAYPTRGKWQVLECYTRPHLDGRGKLVKSLSGRHVTPGNNLHYRVLHSLGAKSAASVVAEALNTLNGLPLQNLQ